MPISTQPLSALFSQTQDKVEVTSDYVGAIRQQQKTAQNGVVTKKTATILPSTPQSMNCFSIVGAAGGRKVGPGVGANVGLGEGIRVGKCVGPAIGSAVVDASILRTIT